MDYVSNLFMLAGIAGFVIGGTAVWLGFATFPAVVVLDLLALDDDLSVRAVRHPRLADVPLYVHALLVPALVAAAAYRVHAGEGGGPLGVGACAGVVLTLGWLGVMPNIPVAHELMHRRERLPRFRWVRLRPRLLAARPALRRGDDARRRGDRHVRTPTASFRQRLQVDVEIRFADLVEATAAQRVDAELELRAQRVAGVLAMSRTDRSVHDRRARSTTWSGRREQPR